MMMPKITLKEAKEKARIKVSRASDFLTNEQLEEVHESNIRGMKTNSFNMIDSYIAEIIARFGYDTYLAWKTGAISETYMVRYIEAERAREARNRLKIENIIVASIAGANRPTESGHAPTSLKKAIKMLKDEEKLAKGGK